MTYKEKYNLLIDIATTVAKGGQAQAHIYYLANGNHGFIDINNLTTVYMLHEMLNNKTIGIDSIGFAGEAGTTGADMVFFDENGEIVHPKQ